MWLASVSQHDEGGEAIGTNGWTRDERKMAEQLLLALLSGVGDPERERLFRMNLTLCLHRGATPEEIARLPADWEEQEGGLAGGPVKVLRTKGVPDLPCSRPCQKPRRMLLTPGRPDLWVPIDCGRCTPCVDRLRAWNEQQARAAARRAERRVPV